MTNQSPAADSGGATGVPQRLTREATFNGRAAIELVKVLTLRKRDSPLVFPYARDAATWGRRALAAGAPRPWRKERRSK